MASQMPQDRPKTAPRGSWGATFWLLKLVLNLDSFWVRFWSIWAPQSGAQKTRCIDANGLLCDTDIVLLFGVVLDHLQEGPRGAHEAPRPPKSAPRGSKRVPRDPNSTPKALQGTPQSILRDYSGITRAVKFSCPKVGNFERENLAPLWTQRSSKRAIVF